MMNPSGSQTALNDLKSSSFTQDHVFDWDTDIFKLDLGMTVRGILESMTPIKDIHRIP